MRRVAIIQARVGSMRLPRKVLMDLGGEAMLAHVVRRVRHARLVDEVVVATTTRGEDDPIAELARALGARVFRGDEHDVLSRYAGAARESAADVVIRITADCPLIDGDVIDRVVAALESRGDEEGVDYASNVLRRTFPRGLDVEALFSDVLERVNRMARSAAAREHVTHFILREHPDLFRVRGLTDTDDNSDLRWTVDEAADLEMARSIFTELQLAAVARPYRDVLAWVRCHPAVAAINAHVEQKA